MKHPVDERNAAVFHATFALLYAFALGFHAISAWAHWRDR